MKALAVTAILAAGIFLTGCETTVVERRHDHGNRGYYRDGRSGYLEGGYRDGNEGTHYRTRNVERTNVYENNVYETRVHRNDVNRTEVKTQSRSGRATVNAQASQKAPTRTTVNVSQQATKKGKGKRQKGDEEHKKHEGDAQERQ